MNDQTQTLAEQSTSGQSCSTVGLGWEREYECQFKRTTGRVVSVCKHIRGNRFSGWYLIREPGEISSHKYRKAEILSMTASLSERKNKA